MKRIDVVYATKTKHSKKLAEAVAAALGVPAQNVMDQPKIGETDLMFIVGGLYGNESLPEMLDFVSGLDSGIIKNAALITNSLANAKGQDSVRSRLQGKGIPVVEEFRCVGGLLFLRAGHPNKAEVQQAVDFAVRLAKEEA